MLVQLLVAVAAGAANPPSSFPPRCTTMDATGTDPEMRWFCQGSGHPEPDPKKWEFRTCTNLHLVCAPPVAAEAKPQLLVFLPGTGLGPMDYTEPVIDMSSHGFYALGLQYPSTQGQNGCDVSRKPAGSTDLNCTARERYRVLTGEASSYGGSDHTTNITAPDSIQNRLAKALLKLGAPWSKWLTGSGAPDWSSIIIAGHSNGADHASFVAKTFSVARALTFAGANDMVDGPNPGKWQHVHAAPWQFANASHHATPPERMYGFGVCGTATHKAQGECYDWHAGWLAQQYPGPWFRADAVLGDATGKGLAGHHAGLQIQPEAAGGGGGGK